MTAPETQQDPTPPEYGMIKSPEAFGQLLRQHRRLMEMTQKDLYAGSGISTRFMSMLERGKTQSVARLLKALHSLGLELIVMPRSAKGLWQFSPSGRQPARPDDGADG